MKLSSLTGALSLVGMCCLGLLLPIKDASGQTISRGFTVNRYEPSSAGEWSFWVDHPWFSKARYFAAGLTLNYGHNPLVFGTVGTDGSFNQQVAVIEHQLLGHLDLAGSFLDRVQINASLPITLLERGTPAAGTAPTSGGAVGDPRLGVWVRLFGQPNKSAVSLSLGAQLWIPLRALGASSGVSETSSDEGVLRFQPKLALGGYASRIQWSVTAGFQYRPPSQIGTGVELSGSSVGSELQLGAALAYADMTRRFAIGPEMVVATQVFGTDATKPFARDFTSLEVLLGAHYNIAHLVNVGLAGGIALLHQPGTPDGRALLRISYAPMHKPIVDRDRDGILDKVDACPNEAGIASSDPTTHGCRDRDRDGIFDSMDACPNEAGIASSDPAIRGCPDRDGDGVVDRQDICPDTPKGDRPDPDSKRLGCPVGDSDRDGVLDPDDICPDVPKGERPDPDPKRLGCPAGDRDKDGVLDPDDLCVDVAKGEHPDPTRLGCPAGDRDHDFVFDHEDACPDTAGAADPDPKKNGCPGQVTVTGGQLKIIEPVFFATNKDVILKRSFPVLDAVANTLKGAPNIRKVEVQGHTDNRGKPKRNRDLSARRAASVMQFLIEKGIAQDRLQSVGYGPDKPIADNKNAKGRELNRRVDFMIIDPAQPQAVQVQKPSEAVVPPSEDQSDKSADKHGKHHRHHKHKGDKADEADAANKADPANKAAEPDSAEKPGKHHRHHKHKGDKADEADAANKAAATDKAAESDGAGKHRKHHRKHKADGDGKAEETAKKANP